jgi:hypothetical protein
MEAVLTMTGDFGRTSDGLPEQEAIPSSEAIGCHRRIAMLVVPRVIRHAVDVRPDEGQEGIAERVQILKRLRLILELDKWVEDKSDGAMANLGADDADGMAAGVNKGVEPAKRVVIRRKDEVGRVLLHNRDRG